MPKKIRDLKHLLRRAGFREVPGRGKGSHSWWVHAAYADLIVELSGNDGADARRYHERDVAAKVAAAAVRAREAR